MRNFFSMAILALLVFSSIQAFADETPNIIEVEGHSFFNVYGVNIRNGNFSVSYVTSQDDQDPSGIPFVRVYNSRSTYKGIFGVGWGSPWDSRMLYMPDGTVIVHENGTGNYTVYGSATEDEKNSEIQNILQVIKRQDPSTLTDALYDDLKKSVSARFEAVLKYGPHIQYHPLNTTLKVDKSTVFNKDYCFKNSQIEIVNGVFNRTFPVSCSQPWEVYDDNGSVSQLIFITTDKNELKKRLWREYNGSVITKTTDEKGKVTKFFYDKKNQLIKNILPSSISFDFTYDERGNMTSIVYIDKSKQLMTYDKEDRTTSVTKRSGDTAKFEYLQDPYNPSISLTRVTTKTDNGSNVTIYKLLN